MGNTSSSGEKAYRIKLNAKNQIGEGSYAIQYKIVEKYDKQRYAAKLYKIPVNQMSSRVIRGFEIELKILKEANHPFVIKYIDDFICK